MTLETTVPLYSERELVEWYEERAAILEYDARLPKQEAQKQAYWQWRSRFPGHAAPQVIRDWVAENTKQEQLFKTG